MKKSSTWKIKNYIEYFHSDNDYIHIFQNKKYNFSIQKNINNLLTEEFFENNNERNDSNI